MQRQRAAPLLSGKKEIAELAQFHFKNEDENRIVNALIHSHLWGILNEVSKRTTLLHLNIKESRAIAPVVHDNFKNIF